MDKQDKGFINPEFKTSTFYGLKPLTKEQILDVLKSDSTIFRTFMKHGFIYSRQYSFITKVTFSLAEKNCIEVGKNEEETLQAKQNLKVVEDYFNTLCPEDCRPLRVEFASRKDNECALYNPDRFNYEIWQVKLREIFD